MPPAQRPPLHTAFGWIIGLLIIARLLPETKGQSLEDIEKQLVASPAVA